MPDSGALFSTGFVAGRQEVGALWSVGAPQNIRIAIQGNAVEMETAAWKRARGDPNPPVIGRSTGICRRANEAGSCAGSLRGENSEPSNPGFAIANRRCPGHANPGRPHSKSPSHTDIRKHAAGQFGAFHVFQRYGRLRLSNPTD